LDLKSARDDQSLPWHVDGSALNLASTPSGDLDIEIEGQPASIHVADGSIQGPRIGFNQLQNRVWMDQPGEFTLPMDIKTANGKSMKWIKPLRCTWKKRMVFDGDRIRFEGDIELLGTLQQQDGLWFVKGNCQELDLQLSQPVKFEQIGKLRQLNEPSQLQQIVLRQNVDLLMSRKDNQGNRISRGRLVVPTTLTIEVPKEKIVAAGPGRGYTNFVNNTSKPLSSAPRSGQPDSASTLNSVSFTYRDNLVVFMDRTEVVVEGNVKILTSPIRSWDDEISPDNVSRLTIGQFSCNSDHVKLYDTADLKSTQSLLTSQGLKNESIQWEVQASGNVRFDGSTESGEYSGNAHQAVYVQAKNQLYVTGDGRSKAVIRKLANSPTAQPEPSTTFKLDKGLFDVKNRSIIDMHGVDVFYENPQGQSQSPNPAQFPNLPGSQLPATAPVQSGKPEDPRSRSINRLLQGFGS
jgi:hypothetical protein